MQRLETLPAPPPAFDDSLAHALNQSWDLASLAPRFASGWRGRLQRFVWGVVAPVVDRQHTFNAALVDHVNRNLDAHREQVKVVLNHEPFFADPGWPFDDEELARYVATDEGIFEEHGVAYSLNGHVHFNSLERGEHTTHISVGALFGMGWYLPPSLFPRGYRIYYARDGQLYAAWKLVGEPLLGFIQPQGEEAIHPASATLVDPKALAGPFDLVAVAADAQGPFKAVSLELDGRSVPLERWGNYFVHARIDPAPLGGETATLTLLGTRESGEPAQRHREVRGGPSFCPCSFCHGAACSPMP